MHPGAGSASVDLDPGCRPPTFPRREYALTLEARLKVAGQLIDQGKCKEALSLTRRAAALADDMDLAGKVAMADYQCAIADAAAAKEAGRLH